MAGIAVYTEWHQGAPREESAKLITMAKSVAAVSGEAITVLTVCADAEAAAQLSYEGVSEIIRVDADENAIYQTDALSAVLADEVKDNNWSAVLVPATGTARALWARVSMKLELGMTADCTDLKTEIVDGRTVIHQIKPSFGSQIMVSCDCTTDPQIITLKAEDAEPTALGAPVAVRTSAHAMPASAITITGDEKIDDSNSLHAAEIVVCAGRGALEDDNFDLIKQYAEKIGAAVAGTRPLADNGWLPFEYQIGQSGTVVRPKVVITFGVSGAIQFTEGIKGDPLVIAVNKDPYAAIFGFADYAVLGDMHDVLTELVK